MFKFAAAIALAFVATQANATQQTEPLLEVSLVPVSKLSDASPAVQAIAALVKESANATTTTTTDGGRATLDGVICWREGNIFHCYFY